MRRGRPFWQRWASPGGGEAAAEQAVQELEECERARPLPAARVVRADAPARLQWRGTVGAEVEIRFEDGTRQSLEVRRGARGVRLPRLDPGVHEVWLSLPGTEPVVQHLVAVPPKCLTVGEVLGERRVAGLWGQLVLGAQ